MRGPEVRTSPKKDIITEMQVLYGGPKLILLLIPFLFVEDQLILPEGFVNGNFDSHEDPLIFEFVDANWSFFEKSDQHAVNDKKSIYLERVLVQTDNLGTLTLLLIGKSSNNLFFLVLSQGQKARLLYAEHLLLWNGLEPVDFGGGFFGYSFQIHTGTNLIHKTVNCFFAGELDLVGPVSWTINAFSGGPLCSLTTNSIQYYENGKLRVFQQFRWSVDALQPDQKPIELCEFDIEFNLLPSSFGEKHLFKTQNEQDLFYFINSIGIEGDDLVPDVIRKCISLNFNNIKKQYTKDDPMLIQIEDCLPGYLK